jgi:hypothetical protein
MDREPEIGEVLVVTKTDGSMPVQLGDRILVTHVDDDDDTVRGTWSGLTPSDFWIEWGNLEPVEFGWEFARRHLPAEVASLLGACRRIEFLSLNPRVKRAIVDGLPDWRERVMAAIDVSSSEADPF